MNFDLEYNGERTHLIIPEYGRHIQKLIDHCINIEDVEERNKMARAIVDVMGNLQPHLRDVPDFKSKLWDQLFIMSDFKLDVDSPYEKLEKTALLEKPERLEYPRYASKYRYYGNNIQAMIKTALTWEEGELRDALYFAIANHMKKCYLNWNKDTVDDAVIFKHLVELSKGEIDLTDKNEPLSEVKNLLKKKKSTNKGTNKQHNKPRPKRKF
ncbi:MAG: methionyl-tRNA formyltransferase [Flavobacteriaceae bacterium]|nr:MAG: methionyl-tRNA formyltransferase [Flavobacteriaceae bacterium]